MRGQRRRTRRSMPISGPLAFHRQSIGSPSAVRQECMNSSSPIGFAPCDAACGVVGREALSFASVIPSSIGFCSRPKALGTNRAPTTQIRAILQRAVLEPEYPPGTVRRGFSRTAQGGTERSVVHGRPAGSARRTSLPAATQQRPDTPRDRLATRLRPARPVTRCTRARQQAFPRGSEQVPGRRGE